MAFALSLDFYNATSQRSTDALLGLIKLALSRHYKPAASIFHDPIATRSMRTRRGALEAELYEDGSGLEVAFLGRILVLGVEARAQGTAL